MDVPTLFQGCFGFGSQRGVRLEGTPGGHQAGEDKEQSNGDRGERKISCRRRTPPGMHHLLRSSSHPGCSNCCANPQLPAQECTHSDGDVVMGLLRGPGPFQPLSLLQSTRCSRHQVVNKLWKWGGFIPSVPWVFLF